MFFYFFNFKNEQVFVLDRSRYSGSDGFSWKSQNRCRFLSIEVISFFPAKILVYVRFLSAFKHIKVREDERRGKHLKGETGRKRGKRDRN